MVWEARITYPHQPGEPFFQFFFCSFEADVRFKFSEGRQFFDYGLPGIKISWVEVAHNVICFFCPLFDERVSNPDKGSAEVTNWVLAPLPFFVQTGLETRCLFRGRGVYKKRKLAYLLVWWVRKIKSGQNNRTYTSICSKGVYKTAYKRKSYGRWIGFYKARFFEIFINWFLAFE